MEENRPQEQRPQNQEKLYDALKNQSLKNDLNVMHNHSKV